LQVSEPDLRQIQGQDERQEAVAKKPDDTGREKNSQIHLDSFPRHIQSAPYIQRVIDFKLVLQVFQIMREAQTVAAAQTARSKQPRRKML
jgi:hypothetical protein